MSKNPGWIVAYTINLGDNEFQDSFTVHPNEAGARPAYDAALLLDNLHCATIATMVDATEPHWLEGEI